jgi:hypothetical protein
VTARARRNPTEWRSGDFVYSKAGYGAKVLRHDAGDVYLVEVLTGKLKGHQLRVEARELAPWPGGSKWNPPRFTTRSARAWLRKLRGGWYLYAWWLQEHVAGRKALGNPPKPPPPDLAAAIARALAAAQGQSTKGAIAAFAGYQERPGGGALELWNLLVDLPGHPAGSTVTRQTIEAAGYALPASAKRNPPVRCLIWGDDAPPRPPKKPKSNPDRYPCAYCGGPGGTFAGPDHATECLRYKKAPRAVRTIRKRKSNPCHKRGRALKTNPPDQRPRGISRDSVLIYPKGRFSRGTTWYGTHRTGGRYKHSFRSDTVKAMYGLPGGGIAFIPKTGRLWGYR